MKEKGSKIEWRRDYWK